MKKTFRPSGFFVFGAALGAIALALLWFLLSAAVLYFALDLALKSYVVGYWQCLGIVLAVRTLGDVWGGLAELKVNTEK